MHVLIELILTLLVAQGIGLTARAEDAPAQAEFQVIGYLPDYRAAELDLNALSHLTDLIVFSAEPSANGELDQSRLKSVPWDRLRGAKTRHRVRMILCAGGWDRSAGFAAIAADPVKRKRFAQSAVRACLDQRLDGLDLDWEHPADATQQQNYARLLADLREAFQPHGLMLSVTLAAWQQLPDSGFAAVDRVQVMAYDHSGRHSTLEGAKADVQSLLDRNVPAPKIILGLPFYGRHLKQPDQTLTWSEIAARYRPASGVDEVDQIYFNGPETLRRKVSFARQSGLGGVMVWELGQDAPGGQSLLRVIRQSVDHQP